MQKLRVPGVIEQVRMACDFVTRNAHEAGMDDHSIFQCELSVDEICTNIIEHGYNHHGRDKGITLYVETVGALFRITIVDEAPRFNPLVTEDPDPTDSLEERGTGGWGVYFVKQYMNTISYRYENGRNCLIIEKALTA